MAGNAIPEEKAKNQAPQSPPRERAVGRVRARHRRGWPLLRWARTVPASRPVRQPTLDPASRDRWAAIRTRSRRVPAGLAEGGANPSLRQPQDRAGRRRSARRQAPRQRSPDVRRGGPHAWWNRSAPAGAIRSTRTTGRRAWSGSCSLGSASAPVSEVTSADVLGVLSPNLARETGDGPPGASAHRRRHALGRGNGVPGRQPVRTGHRNARAPARCSPTHACAASSAGRRGGGYGPDVGSDPPRPSWRSSSWC